MDVKLANCARCKRVYTRIRSELCPECQDAEEMEYVKIRDLLAEHPGLTMEEAAEQAGVSKEVICRMVRDGQIAPMESDEPITCGRCGAPVSNPVKRLCTACLFDLDAKISNAVKAGRQVPRKVSRQAMFGVHQALEIKRRR